MGCNIYLLERTAFSYPMQDKGFAYVSMVVAARTPTEAYALAGEKCGAEGASAWHFRATHKLLATDSKVKRPRVLSREPDPLHPDKWDDELDPIREEGQN